MRITLLHNVLNPHMVPVFEALGRTKDTELTVLYFAETEGDRTWAARAGVGFESAVLPSKTLNLFFAKDTLSFHWNPTLLRELARRRPDVVINSGWSSPTSWAAFASCRRRHIPHVLWAGSTEYEESWLRPLVKPLVRTMVAGSQGWVSYGTASARYLETLGAPKGAVVPSFHCIDNARFLSECAEAEHTVPALRARLGLEGKRVVLFVGRMVAVKGVDVLLEAFARGAPSDVHLVLAGDGPKRREWEAWAAERLAGRAHFVGGVRLEALAPYYLLADLFVLPSVSEVWGLVLNEAGLAGLPVIASDRCGAAEDLVRNGENGFVFPAGDVSALARALADALESPERTRTMGDASRRRVARCSPAGVAAALAEGARRAMDTSREPRYSEGA
jgi:glycosyltransferase involved in cell wall biosynthesis